MRINKRKLRNIAILSLFLPLAIPQIMGAAGDTDEIEPLTITPQDWIPEDLANELAEIYPDDPPLSEDEANAYFDSYVAHFSDSGSYADIVAVEEALQQRMNDLFMAYTIVWESIENQQPSGDEDKDTEEIAAKERYLERIWNEIKRVVKEKPTSWHVDPEQERTPGYNVNGFRVCLISVDGFARCGFERQAFVELATTTPRGIDGHVYLDRTRRMQDIFDIDRATSNTLMACSNGITAGINTDMGSVLEGTGQPPLNINPMPGERQTLSMISACRQSLRLGHGTSGAYSNSLPSVDGPSSLEQNAKNHLNETMDMCTDSPISDGMSGSGDLIDAARKRQDIFEKNRFGSSSPLGTSYSAALSNMIRGIDSWSEERRIRLEAQSIRAQAEYELNEAKARLAVAIDAKANATTDAEREAADAEIEAAQADMEEASKNIGVAEEMDRSGRDKIERDEDAEEAEEEEEASNESGGCGRKKKQKPSSGGDPSLEGADLSTCATMRQALQLFMDQCDNANGWNRIGTECNEYARRASGCVSSTLIMPTPDGETCKTISEPSPETLDRCSQQRKVSTVANDDAAFDCPVITEEHHLPSLIDHECQGLNTMPDPTNPDCLPVGNPFPESFGDDGPPDLPMPFDPDNPDIPIPRTVIFDSLRLSGVSQDL